MLRYDFIAKTVELADTFDSGLKKSVSKKAIVGGLIILGVVAIVLATVLDFS